MYPHVKIWSKLEALGPRNGRGRTDLAKTPHILKRKHTHTHTNHTHTRHARLVEHIPQVARVATFEAWGRLAPGGHGGPRLAGRGRDAPLEKEPYRALSRSTQAGWRQATFPPPGCFGERLRIAQPTAWCESIGDDLRRRGCRVDGPAR